MCTERRASLFRDHPLQPRVNCASVWKIRVLRKLIWFSVLTPVQCMQFKHKFRDVRKSVSLKNAFLCHDGSIPLCAEPSELFLTLSIDVFESSEWYVKWRSSRWGSFSRTLSIQQIQNDLFTCLNRSCWCWMLLKIWWCLKQSLIMTRAETGK